MLFIFQFTDNSGEMFTEIYWTSKFYKSLKMF